MINPAKLFIERPKATLLLVFGYLGVGLLAYFRLPLAALPEVEYPTISISASLPGADAVTMASSVASPLERYLGSIAGVTAMTSVSSLGHSSVTLQFDLNRNIDAAAQDVQAAINAAAGLLPANLPNPPTYSKADPNHFAFISIAAYSDTVPLPKVNDWLDTTVARVIAAVPGVSQVDYHGTQLPAVRVQINPLALAAYSLDLENVRSAVAAATVDLPKGTLNGPDRTLLVSANDQLLGARQFDDVVVASRGGAPVRLRDIGRAIEGPEELYSGAWLGDHRAIVLDTHKLPGANVAEVSSRILALMPEFRRMAPPGIKLQVVADRTQTTRASVTDVEVTLGITIVLVAAVIFLFLGDITATLIPAFSIPLSLIGSFPAMLAMGFNLDTISLMGLTIAVGFVVDDAIVVIENVTRHLEMGKERLEAAIAGTGEVVFTVISMTLSLIAVFLPLLLMGGIVGRLFREFSLAVTFAVLLSAVVSLTQTAVACSLFLKPPAEQKNFMHRISERGFGALLAFYRGGLTWMLRHRRTGLGITVAMAAGSAWLFAVIPKGFVPEQDIGMISIATEASPDISYRDMSAKQLQLADIAMREPEAASVYSYVERSPTINNGRTVISLVPFAQRRVNAAQFIARLRPKLQGITGMKVFAKAVQDVQLNAGFTKSNYQFVLQDADIGELLHWSAVFSRELARRPELQDVATDLDASSAGVSVIVDRDKASGYGISVEAIDQVLYDAFGERQVATLFTQATQRRVVLEVQPGWNLDAHSLEALFVHSPTSGAAVPLAAMAHLAPALSPTMITHLSALPAVSFSFNVTPGHSLGEAVDAIRRMEGALGKPPSLQTSFQGATQAFQAAMASQPYLIGAAILVVYIILGVLYESLLHPLTILSSLPSAAFGALLAMAVFHYDLSVITLIGLILLVGLVKKNAIMMVDVALGRQRDAGMNAEAAIFEACLVRFRPIMMTTLAALLGAIPLAVAWGAGSEFRRPLGVAIVGGLAMSQLVTLYTVPVIFVYFDRLTRWPFSRAHALPA